MFKKLLIVSAIAFQFFNCGFPKPVERGSYAEREEWEKILEKTQIKYPGLDTANLISHIKFYLGTPYKYGGANRSGMDCSGFVMRVFKNAFKVTLPHNAKQIFDKTKSIPLKNIKLGDLVFFENTEGGGISHVAIYLTDANFVHASSGRGVTISSFRNDYYKDRFKGVRRVLKLHFS